MERTRHSTATLWKDNMPDRAYRLALLGMTQTEIALILGIHITTFEDWLQKKEEFKEAILRGRHEADGHIVESLYRKATGYSHPDTQFFVIKGEVVEVPTTKHYPPDTAAAIFLLKNRTRDLTNPWIDLRRQEVTGKNGGAIELKDLDNLDLSDLSNEELEVMLKMIPNIRQKINSKKGDSEEYEYLNENED